MILSFFFISFNISIPMFLSPFRLSSFVILILFLLFSPFLPYLFLSIVFMKDSKSLCYVFY